MGNSTSALFNATRATLLRPGSRVSAPVNEDRATLPNDLVLINDIPAVQEESYEQFVERYSESLLQDVVDNERPSVARPRRVLVSSVPQMARLFVEHASVAERPKERAMDMSAADYAAVEAALDVEYTGNPGNLPPSHYKHHDLVAPLLGAALLGGLALGATLLMRSVVASSSTRA